jgi:Leucine-rich repeat (LRR) protein
LLSGNSNGNLSLTGRLEKIELLDLSNNEIEDAENCILFQNLKKLSLSKNRISKFQVAHFKV